MIYDLHHCYLFIPIPRTAGVAITRALAGVASHCVVDLTAGRHMTAAALKQRLGDCWHQFRPWAIARSPWDIVLSDYRPTLRDLYRPRSSLSRSISNRRTEFIPFPAVRTE